MAEAELKFFTDEAFVSEAWMDGDSHDPHFFNSVSKQYSHNVRRTADTLTAYREILAPKRSLSKAVSA